MISVLVTSMRRPKFLEESLSRVRKAHKGDLEVITVIDEDRESLEVALKYSDKVIFNVSRQGALRCWNTALWHATGEYLFPLGDDNWCYENCLDLALTCHEDKMGGYGVVGLNDMMHNGYNICTMPFFDRGFCIDHLGGVFAVPLYKYYCVDNEVFERSVRADKYYWCEEAVCEHMHPANGKRPEDDIDREKVEKFWGDDLQLLSERRDANFPNNFEPIIWEK